MIKCCHGCVAPKRYPGCHDHCPDYILEKFINDLELEERNKENAKFRGIYEQRDQAIRRARRNCTWTKYRGGNSQ